jgi:hypothetical protein
MKKILLTLLFFAFIVGCDTDASDNQKCLQVARKTYPNAVMIPERSFRYIARDSKGNIHYIEVMRKLEDGITTDYILMLAEEK